MKISLNWLNDYIDIKKEDPKEMADNITKSGVAIEKINKLCDVTGLIVARIKEVKKHEESDKLNVCIVDTGTEELQVVCGAPNVVKGIKVIFSPVGTILPGNFEIKMATIRNVSSEGMICALDEIGVPKEFLSKEDLSSIHILADTAVVGENALNYIDFDDVIYELDLNPNRSDCLSMIGFAYEAAILLGKKVNHPPVEIKELDEKAGTKLSLEINTLDASYYTARVIKDVEIKDSPDYIKARLIAAGMRPINNVVDISNYVMLEYGQPLHFFDADKLGNKIVVRMAKKDEKTITLDDKERCLTTDDIVITDSENVVAIAGVMGGKSTEVDANTKNIIIESAIFNPLNIRSTSIRLDLRSEASLRFEKGLNSEYTIKALNRAAELLEKYAGAKILNGIIEHNEVKTTKKTIQINSEKINKVLGVNLSEEKIESIFNHLDFKVEKKENTYFVTIPNRRRDVNIPEDLIEEVGRIYGFHNIKGKLPTGNLKSAKISAAYKTRKEIKKRLEALGLSEMRTFSLVPLKEAAMFTAREVEVVKVLKPVNKEKEAIRQSIIPSLLEVFDYNIARNQNDVMIYEVSTTYGMKNDYLEEWKVAGILCGEYLNDVLNSKKINIDFFTVKGIVENLLNFLGLKGRYTFKNNDIPNEFHPGVTASINIGNEVIGYIGRIHPSIKKEEVFGFELSISKILNQKVRKIKHQEPIKFPSIVRDMAFVIDEQITNFEITKVISKAGGKLLKSVYLFDLYSGKNIDKNKKSLAFNLVFEDDKKTLTDEEINQAISNIINEVDNKVSGKLRT